MNNCATVAHQAIRAIALRPMMTAGAACITAESVVAVVGGGDVAMQVVITLSVSACSVALVLFSHMPHGVVSLAHLIASHPFLSAVNSPVISSKIGHLQTHPKTSTIGSIEAVITDMQSVVTEHATAFLYGHMPINHSSVFEESADAPYNSASSTAFASHDVQLLAHDV